MLNTFLQNWNLLLLLNLIYITLMRAWKHHNIYTCYVLWSMFLKNTAHLQVHLVNRNQSVTDVEYYNSNILYLPLTTPDPSPASACVLSTWPGKRPAVYAKLYGCGGGSGVVSGTGKWSHIARAIRDNWKQRLFHQIIRLKFRNFIYTIIKTIIMMVILMWLVLCICQKDEIKVMGNKKLD